MFGIGSDSTGEFGDDLAYPYEAGVYRQYVDHASVLAAGAWISDTQVLRSVWYRSSVITDVASVSEDGSMFIKTDGTLWAQGNGKLNNNQNGRLGTKSTTDVTDPVQVATDVVSVATAADHTLFIKTDGTLWAMGSNLRGQLGIGAADSGTHYEPVQVAEHVVSVAVGTWVSFYIDTNGWLWGMGDNQYGQLGVGSATGLYPTAMKIAELVQSVSTNGTDTLFLTASKTVMGMGMNVTGSLADGTTTRRTSPITICVDVAKARMGGEGFRARSLFLLTNGTLWGAGWNTDYGLGDGTKIERHTKVQIASDVVDFATSLNPDTVYKKVDGSVWYVGAGRGPYAASNYNFPVRLRTGVTSVASYSMHSLFVTTDGTLWGAGVNLCGELGPTKINSMVLASVGAPLQVDTDVVRAVGDGYSTHYIKRNQELWAAGDNSAGQLGDTTTTTRTAPVLIAANVTDVASAGVVAAPAFGVPATAHLLFVQSDGSLWVSGANLSGQLGDGLTDARSTPFRLLPSGVKNVACGHAHSLYLTTDGSLWGMGDNSCGQLGGTVGSHLTPIPIAGRVVSISAGGFSSLYVTDDGTLWALGHNGHGKLGDGTVVDRSTPVPIDINVASVSAGRGNAFYIKKDGTLWGVGMNDVGQLGDGTYTECHLPRQVAVGVTQVAAGRGTVLFLQELTPTITGDPQPQICTEGELASFSVTAHGAGTLTYQWRKDTVAIPGATARTLLLDGVKAGDAGNYDVVVTTPTGFAVSAAAALTVNELTMYSAWAGAAGLVGDPLVDLDGSGVPPWLRYGFKLPAHGPVTTPATVSTVTSGERDFLAISFFRRTTATDLKYVVEASTDLVTWTTISTVLPGSPQEVRVLDLVAITDAPRRFLRVRVASVP